MVDRSFSLDVRGAVAWLTLRHPSLDDAGLTELSAHCEAISDDDEVRVAVLIGEGDAFCDGEFEGPARGDPLACLAELPRPVVCAINGEALGLGLEIALACDIRIASEHSRFGLPAVAGGRLPAAGGTQRLPRLVGRGNALEIILTGEPIDAAEALRIGLVSAVVPRDRLVVEAVAVAARIAERGPLAVRYAKEAISRGLEMPLEQALRYETDLTIILQSTEDRAEGVRAFLEKRKPEFKGK